MLLNHCKTFVALAIICAAGQAQASNPYMEQCKVVDKDGNNLIKPYSADSGANLANDPDAWIWVPYGQCAKLNRGDYSGVSPEVLDKIETGDTSDAQTVE